MRAECPGPPDLIEGDEPVVQIEGRILNALRHDRAGYLLELHGKIEPCLARLIIHIGRELKEKDPLHEEKDRLVEDGIPPDGPGDGKLDVMAVPFLLVGSVYVCPVDREAGYDSRWPLEVLSV